MIPTNLKGLLEGLNEMLYPGFIGCAPESLHSFMVERVNSATRPPRFES